MSENMAEKDMEKMTENTVAKAGENTAEKTAENTAEKNAENKKEKRFDLRAMAGVLISLVIGVGLYGGYRYLLGEPELLRTVIREVTTPYKRMMGYLCDFVPISVMEIVVAAGVLAAIVWLIVQIVQLVKRPGRITRGVKMLLTAMAAALLIWDGYCWLWGVNYYGDGFEELSGLTAEPVAADELHRATRYYTDMVNLYSTSVRRDANGLFNEDMAAYFADSDKIYAGLIPEYPFLDSPSRTPKKMIASELMSVITFTGVYFPFAGETNLNVNAPPSLIPATVAHELAHQKNIAAEQEANFLAVKASVTSEMPVYIYSGALMAYIHLSNALYEADYDAWEENYYRLSAEARADLDYNNAYWAKYETKTAEAAETVYEAFLQSYDQELGMKSYGACVDLLVADYLRMEAEAYAAYVGEVDGVS